MLTKSFHFKCLVFIVMFVVLIRTCDSREIIRTKFKRKVGSVSDVRNNYIWDGGSNVTTGRDNRGFGSIFALGKVLNFFPVGGERECVPTGHLAARAGICLNPYDCRQRDGHAAGGCAHGLGVCCVFEVTCGAVIQNNLTYFMSPGFPELWMGESECTVHIEKAFAGIMQLRIDFVHFTIGQPNRTTGECDEDAMILGDGSNNLTLCGQNHGQHIYYTVSSHDARAPGDLPAARSTRLTVRMRGSDTPRLWLLRLAQMPLAYSAPNDCLQYYTHVNGTIKSFNYAINGRHLAAQEYRACVRRDTGYCAVRYSPCDARSFRIGPSGDAAQAIEPADYELGPGGLGGAGTGFYGPEGIFLGPVSTVPPTTPRATTAMVEDQLVPSATSNETMQVQDQMPGMEEGQPQEDVMEGSGADPQVATPIESGGPAPQKGYLSMLWDYIWPSWLWGQGRTYSWTRWSPYTQHYKPDDNRFYSYGNFGAGLSGFGRQRCSDRVTIPCENEYFLSSVPYGAGVCDPHHCGNSFCPGVELQHCHVETSIMPFAVSFHFGPPSLKRNPEENIGACLRYTQLPCDS